MVDEDLLHSILENSTETLFLFDSNSLSDYAYQLVAHSEKLLKKKNNKLVVATNTNDIYLPDTLNAETVLLTPSFEGDEIKQLIPACDKYGLSRRKQKKLTLIISKDLVMVKKLIFQFSIAFPKSLVSKNWYYLCCCALKINYTSAILVHLIFDFVM